MLLLLLLLSLPSLFLPPLSLCHALSPFLFSPSRSWLVATSKSCLSPPPAAFNISMQLIWISILTAGDGCPGLSAASARKFSALLPPPTTRPLPTPRCCCCSILWPLFYGQLLRVLLGFFGFIFGQATHNTAQWSKMQYLKWSLKFTVYNCTVYTVYIKNFQ